jgi:hypothetical protein
MDKETSCLQLGALGQVVKPSYFSEMSKDFAAPSTANPSQIA